MREAAADKKKIYKRARSIARRRCLIVITPRYDDDLLQKIC